VGGGRYRLRPGALRAARRRKLLSAAELGRRAGVAESTILRIERGQGALPATVRKLAEALEVDPGELVEEGD
jgi:transcriptional regulator with XRE-family HTH domain